MAGLSFAVVKSQGRPKSFCISHIGQHLPKLLGCRRYDGDEVSLAKPALDAMAPEVTARSAMQHRRVRGGDAGLADVQAKLDDPAPIAVVRVERVSRQLH